MDAGVSLGLSGPDALHTGHAAAGLAVWASDQGVELHVEDDGGSAEVAALNYGRFVDRGVDVLLGPYGSGMVRRLAPLVCDRGRLLWNHGGSADDLARPNLVSVTAPASTYFHESIEVALSEGVTGAVFVHGRGRFGRAVARGGEEAARGLGMEARVVDTGTWRQQGWQPPSRWAVLFSSTFDDDVELVREASRRPAPVGLVGCVAAGIDAFGDRLDELAEGVVGPSQWFPDASEPDVGPSGEDFARRFEERHGEAPDYVAAQAAATGYLAAEACRRRLSAGDVRDWRTTTMLGPFALDRGWVQGGYVPVAVRWREGRRVRALRAD